MLIRRLIGVAMDAVRTTTEILREKLFRLTGRDILLCPHCSKGLMVPYYVISPLNSS